MKLKRIKLLSPFRGLPANYEIDFNISNVSNENVEPICFVGLNGSGKSNALELIAEMFYYLENIDKASKKNLNVFKTAFGFELEYYLPKITLAGSGFSWKDLENLTYDNLDSNQLIEVIKAVNELPKIKVHFNNKFIEIEGYYNYEISKVLPKHIIGYSSGSNELLSNPFIKLNFDYYNELNRKKNKPTESTLEMNRFQFLDYDISKLITVTNFIFDKDLFVSDNAFDLSVIKNELEIESLKTFSISLSLKKPQNFEKYLPNELELDIEKFKELDPLFEEKSKKTGRHDFTQLKFNFNLNPATVEGFRTKFLNPSMLFRSLYFLQILNIEKISRNIGKMVSNAKAGTSENLSDLIPKYEIEKQLFHLGNISFKKNNVSEPIFYKHFSDGEHQLLQILGSAIMLNTNSTLFLMDEPETHFNPEWRSKFIWLINECLKANKTEDLREQEFLLTTHSPFLVSDSKKGNVIWLKSDKVDGPQEVNINTYGTSINKLISEFFGKQRQIADLSWKEMLVDLESNDIDELNEALSKYGDSHEKSMILQKLNKLILEKGIE